MSRSGYNDGDIEDQLAFGRWRAQVANATRGARGQRFFVDMIAALDALPERRLVVGYLETDEGAVCALGALGRKRGVALGGLDTYDHDGLGDAFDIARQLAQETMYMNDEHGVSDSDEDRWSRVRAWAVRQLTPETLIGMADSEVKP